MMFQTLTLGKEFRGKSSGEWDRRVTMGVKRRGLRKADESYGSNETSMGEGKYIQ